MGRPRKTLQGANTELCLYQFYTLFYTFIFRSLKKKKFQIQKGFMKNGSYFKHWIG
jgi:hypothetical protein